MNFRCQNHCKHYENCNCLCGALEYLFKRSEKPTEYILKDPETVNHISSNYNNTLHDYMLARRKRINYISRIRFIEDERQRAVLAMFHAGIPIARIAKLIKLSRMQVYNIAKKTLHPHKT